MAIDWSRLAEPQDDGYDARITLHLAATRASPGRQELYVRRPVGEDPTIFAGRVAVRAITPEITIPSSAKGRPEPGPLRHPNIDRGAALLDTWPAAALALPLLFDTLHPLAYAERPLDDPRFVGGSSFSAEARFGAMAATINSPIALAEAFVREMAHQKLRAFGVASGAATRLVLNPPHALYKLADGDAERRMPAIIHEIYARTHVARLDVALLAELSGDAQLAWMRRRLVKDVRRLLRALDRVRQELVIDTAGQSFFRSFFDWARRVISSATGAVAGVEVRTGEMGGER
jgi:hypothetical protein